jgi:hypothetical protein
MTITEVAGYVISSDGVRPVDEGLTREAEKSLWLSRAIAGRVAADPQAVLSLAQRNLSTMEDARGWGTNPWLARWRQILAAGVDVVLDVLTSRDREAVELRANNPFAGVLPPREREAVLRAFTRHWRVEHA